METSTSREIVENLKALVKFFNSELVIIEKAPVKTRGRVMCQLLK